MLRTMKRPMALSCTIDYERNQDGPAEMPTTSDKQALRQHMLPYKAVDVHLGRLAHAVRAVHQARVAAAMAVASTISTLLGHFEAAEK